MSTPTVHAVNVLFNDKWFQMVLSLLIVIGYIVLSALNHQAEAATFEKLFLTVMGYWFGQMGSSIAIAQRVETATVQKVNAQKVRSDYGE